MPHTLCSMTPKQHQILIAAAAVLLAASSLMAQPPDMGARVDALFADYNKPGVPGAAVMVIKDGTVLHANAYGLANLETHTPVTTSTNFRLASFTKQFTAMAIMILADRRQLSLDAHLTDFFPEFPAYGRDITVRQMLNHTSGFPDYGDLLPTSTTIPLLDRDVLWIMEQHDKTEFPPGTKFHYGNTGYALLAVIVEKVSGETFAAFMKKNIFDPLHMTNTLLNERGISSIPNRADGYSTAPATGFKRTDQSLTSYVLGDGGIYSSVNDLYQWDQALYTTTLVGRDLLEQAFTPGTSTQDGEKSYGFGWGISQYRGLKCYSHSGGTVGFSTMIKRFPDQKFTVIMLANRNPATAGPITDKITDMVLFGLRSATTELQTSGISSTSHTK